jgi:DNA-3-methyladenine glycosylase II
MAGRPTAVPKTSYGDAVEHLLKCQVPLRELILRIGPCTWTPGGDLFGVLIRTIVSQQLSTTAAETIGDRLKAMVGRGSWQPEKVLKASHEKLRSCGLSTAKANSLHDLAQKIVDRTVPLKKFSKMEDDEIRGCLLEVKGIGPWSVDMFMMFGLGRTDILPVGDLGFRAGVRDTFALPELPGAVELEELSVSWRPYRSIATWYFWRSRGEVPASDNDAKNQTAAARRKRS